jgi:methylphosphotriester-DNA--protein-cysteine methyltransferase
MYPGAAAACRAPAAERAQNAAAGGIVARCARPSIRNLAQDRVRLAGIAAELGLSPRTLQRKLADAGASFQQVLDAARYALARTTCARRPVAGRHRLPARLPGTERVHARVPRMVGHESGRVARAGAGKK